MKVLYDYQIFTRQNYGGISRYFYELMNNFYKKNVDFKFPINYSENIYLKDALFLSSKLKGYNKYENFLFGLNFKGKNKTYKLFRMLKSEIINRKLSIKYLKEQNFDIFHPTYYNPYFLKYIGKKPFILTIHDMIHELYPQIFLKINRVSCQKKLLAQKAKKIIVTSKNTKKDVIKLLGINEKKIQIIYHGNSINSQKNDSKTDKNLLKKLQKKYILFVGKRNLYKNFNTFIKAVATILKNNNDLNLICAGGEKFTKKEINFFKTLNIDSKIFQYSANDIDLTYFYKNAIIFVYPSLYEGFGIPILESFSCGCPIDISNSSSLPEIAGEAALYFNPNNIKSITDTVNKLIRNQKLRKVLILNGFERIKKFSWNKTAEKTLKIYNEI